MMSMPSYHRSGSTMPCTTRVLVVIGIVLSFMHVGLHAQTDGIQTFQGFRIERNDQPGAFITFLPPNSAITAYTLRWPPTPPTSGQALAVTGTGPYQLTWSSNVGVTIELVSSTNGNLRRVGSLNEGGIAGTPGNYSNDFQGSRANNSQTASGNYSLIGGGQNNTASGNYSLVLGGLGNTASGQYSLVAGGNGNTASGQGAAILGGNSNTNAGPNAAIGGGANNSIAAAGSGGFIGGGTNNQLSGANAFVGGGQDNNASGVYSVIGGGASNVASDTGAVVGGGSNNTASGRRSVVVGGANNTASGQRAFIGAGQNNLASGTNSVIGGGAGNTASGTNASVGGGNSNSAGGDYSFIGGGQSNTTSTGTHMAIGAGQSNSITGSFSFIGGGQNNSIASSNSTIPGGRNMTLAAGSDGSFGFNGGGGNMSISTANAFVIANSNLWLANNNNAARELRFYEAYNTAGAFPGATTNYVSFKAPAATNLNLNNTYTLPDRVGAAGQVLRLSAATATTGTMEWVDGVTTIRTNTVNVTADNQAITAAQLDNMTYMRFNSDGLPVNRTITLPNGITNGYRLIIRCVAAVAGNGVELVNGGNLSLNGGALLENLDTIMLVWDGTSNLWVELSRSNN